jgi:hypothetical protein
MVYMADIMEQQFDHVRVSVDVVNFTFRNKIPDEKPNTAFDLYKALYEADPSRFMISAPLHSNHPGDPLHISLRVKIQERWSHQLHLNCFYTGTIFMCYEITIKHFDTISVVARFNYLPS